MIFYILLARAFKKKKEIAWVHLSWVFDGKMPPPDLNVQ